MWSDDLTQLRSLVAVVDTGSVVAAARALGYSTAAVSRHLSALERELETVLFERTGRSLRPSVMTRVVVEKARLLLDEADQFARDIRSLTRGDEGVVRFAYFRAVGTTLLPLVLAIFAAQRPAARVVLIECALSEEVVDKLRGGDADLGVIWGFTDPEDAVDLETVPLFREALVLLTSVDREDLHVDPRNLSTLVGEPFSGPPTHQGSPPIVDEMFVALGLPAPVITHRVRDHAMSKALIAAGVVVSLIPALGISDSVPGVRRSVVTEDFRRVYLARAPRTANPLAHVLEGSIRQAVRRYSGFGIERLI